MKYSIRLVLAVALITTTFFSCKKDISLQPYYFAPATYATENQLYFQLASVYSPMQTDQFYAQGLWGYLEGGADESFRSGTNATTVLTELYNINATEANIANFWRQLYNGIERANVLIDGAQRVTMDSVKRNNMVGQAKFLRAYYYYLCVTRFGGVEGVPLKLKLSTEMGTDFNLPRTSSKEVYDYIINEMTESEAMVPSINVPQSWQSSAPTPSVVSKSAIQAILARVCLSAAGKPVSDNSKYQLALTWAQKLISSNLHTLNSASLVAGTPAYARVFINNVKNNIGDPAISEQIWDAAFLSKSNVTGSFANTGFNATQTLGAIMGVYCPDASGTSVIGFSPGTYRVHNKLYQLYNAGDLRRDWAVAPYVYKNNTNTKYATLSVTITGGGGTGASATAYTSSTGAITSVVIDNGGTGYTSAPTISFTAYATNTTIATVGTGATATAVVGGGKVTAINITDGGIAYPTAYDRCVGKWRREYEMNLPTIRLQNNTSTNFPIVRYADVLLMAAEADLKKNGSPTAVAVEYYNQVRRRAFGFDSKQPNPSIDVTIFTLQDIMDERSRELCFEGVRRMDLIRWGTMTAAMQNIVTDVNNNAPASYAFSAAFAANNFLGSPEKFSVFPMPAAFELAQNAALTQNPGW